MMRNKTVVFFFFSVCWGMVALMLAGRDRKESGGGKVMRV